MCTCLLVNFCHKFKLFFTLIFYRRRVVVFIKKVKKRTYSVEHVWENTADSDSQLSECDFECKMMNLKVTVILRQRLLLLTRLSQVFSQLQKYHRLLHGMSIQRSIRKSRHDYQTFPENVVY